MKQKLRTALRVTLKAKGNSTSPFTRKSLFSENHITSIKSSISPFSTTIKHCQNTNFVKTTQRPNKASPILSRLLTTSVFVATTTLTFALIYTQAHPLYAETPHNNEPETDDTPTSEPRRIRLHELSAHGPYSPTPWILHHNRVYDITSFLPLHPGGDIILRAAGGSIDPYWDIFSIHKTNGAAELLEEYYIGDLDERDLDGKGKVGVDDPFKGDPERDGGLVVLNWRPFNAESGEDGLREWRTENGVFYVRNHFWVPEIRPEQHKLVVEMPDGEEKEYSLEDLKEKFKETTITATLQCSGNRRKHMTENARTAAGLQWGVGAISNAVWTGVRLRDVLADAGLDVDELPEDAKHAQFVGAEAYGSSIPIETAVDKRGDVLLAYEMNGEPLPPDHGFPLRVLVPGTVAARSVKWVKKVVVSEDESTSQWQRRDYKCFGPNVKGNPEWDEAPAIQEMPVQSAITGLREVSRESQNDRILLQGLGTEGSWVIVEGYAWSGGGRKITRVDVSADDGKSWHQAELQPDESLGSKAWSWKRWRWVIPRTQAGSCFVVKAADEAGNSQPKEYEPYWNFRGHLTNSWHRVDKRQPET